MVEEGLRVRFIGDDGNLSKTLGSLTDQLKRFKDGLKEATNVESFNRIQRAIDATKGRMADLTGGSKKLTGATGQAGQAMTNFGRILQDLPFGPAGIANNLEGAAQAMKALKEQSAQTGQSIGSILLQQLKGGGGLIASVSIVSAALSFAAVGLDAWTRMFGGASKSVDEHKKKLQETKQALEDYVASLEGVSRANLVGEQNAQEQLVKLQTLYKASQDANVPLAERKKLVDALQEQYPKYFKNISDETILAGGAQKAYEQLSNAILQSARARAAQEGIVELQKQILTLERQSTDAMTEEFKAAKTLAKQQDVLNKVKTGSQNFLGTDALSYTLHVADAQGSVNDALQKETGLYKQLNGLRKQAKDLSDEILKNVEANGAGVLTDPTGKLKDAAKGAKPQFNFFDQFFDVKPDKNRIEQQVTDMAKIAKDFASKNFNLFQGLDAVLFAPSKEKTIEAGKIFWDNFQKGLVLLKPPEIKLPDLNLVPEVKPDDTKKFIEEYINGVRRGMESQSDKEGIKAPDLFRGEKSFEEGEKKGKQTATEIQKIYDDLGKDTAKAVNNALKEIQVAGFASIGEAIGQALSGGDIGSVFQGLANQIGSVIQQLGKKIIELGVVAAATRTAIASLLSNPALAIGAGIALTALGTAFKNLTVPKLAAGGLAYGNAFVNVGEYSSAGSNPEVISPLNKLGPLLARYVGGGSGGELRARGSDLVLVQARTNRSQRRGG